MDAITLCKVDRVALGTWVLALGTIALDVVTLKLYLATRQLARSAQESLQQQAVDSRERAEDSKTDLKVRLHLQMEEKFEGKEMLLERALLASSLLRKLAHHEIREAVMNFFEALGILDRRRMLDDELTWNTFSFYATRWWTACKGYVEEERKRQEEDPGNPLSFTEFEELAARLYDKEARARGIELAEVEPEPDEIEKFLHDEFALRPDALEHRP